MRLYLSSFGLGNCPERLAELTRGGTSVAVIANATDGRSADERIAAVEREVDALSALGLDAEEVDLRAFFDRSDVEGLLRRFDLLWVRGGDVFTLRYVLARSGADDAIVRLLEEDGLVYGGYSAGACVLGPTLRGLELVDDPGSVTRRFDAEPRWDGLGVLDFCIVPHVASPGHPETEACERVAERFRSSGTPHQALRDGDVLIIDGERRR